MMSSFPRDGVNALRAWLDEQGYNNKFEGWTADALLGASEEIIMKKFKLPEEEEEFDMLCGFLETARRDRDRRRGAKSDSPPSLTKLISTACKIPEHQVSQQIISRMITRFQGRVSIALNIKDYDILAQAYQDTLRLPCTATELEIETSLGYILDNSLLQGNNNNDSSGSGMQVCFKKNLPHVMKVCSTQEYTRVKAFQDTLDTTEAENEYCESLISFQLFKIEDRRVISHSEGEANYYYYKYFMFMPMHSTTLQHLPWIHSNITFLFWDNLSRALNFLHSKGFAHNDVKPSNILISTTGRFILTDLGSLVQFNQRSPTTHAYIPRDLWDYQNNCGPLASSTVDYWMLAMVIFEKVCRGNLSGGAEPPSTQHILMLLRTVTKVCFCHCKNTLVLHRYISHLN